MSLYIPRLISSKIIEIQPYYPVTVITGPRQSGKSTLCRQLFPDYSYVNLEDLTMRIAAMNDPTSFVDNFGNNVIFDEVQNVPEIFSMIQVRADADRSRRFILTGSSNFALLKRVSQSLAGRAALFTLLPFSFPELDGYHELGKTDISRLIVQGQYPGVIATNAPYESFYSNYYQTYVERDVRDYLNLRNIVKFDTFIRLLAARTGSEFNASAAAREVGVSAPTINEWLSILSASYIVYSVRPYFNNISKRLTKMPKVYFYDTGLLCYLLGVDGEKILEKSSLYGAIFENLAMGELVKSRLNHGREANIYFFREASGKEVDALVPESGKINLYEIKSGRTFQAGYCDNMNYLSGLIPDETGLKTVIYNGPTISSTAVNIREI